MDMCNGVNGFTNNNNYLPTVDMECNEQLGQGHKRRRYDEDVYCPSEYPTTNCHGRQFLPIRRGGDVYVTDEWKTTGTSLFMPLLQDMFINIHKYEQLTTSDGTFFVADESGNYSKSVIGKVLQLWRYDKIKKQFYIAQSFLFTNPQDFCMIQSILHVL